MGWGANPTTIGLISSEFSTNIDLEMVRVHGGVMFGRSRRNPDDGSVFSLRIPVAEAVLSGFARSPDLSNIICAVHAWTQEVACPERLLGETGETGGTSSWPFQFDHDSPEHSQSLMAFVNCQG